MISALIIFIEFLIIIIMVLVIKGYGKERYLMKQDVDEYYKKTAFCRSEHNKLVLQQAHGILQKLSRELFRESFKKNKAAKEALHKFYETLAFTLTK